MKDNLEPLREKFRKLISDPEVAKDLAGLNPDEMSESALVMFSQLADELWGLEAPEKSSSESPLLPSQDQTTDSDTEELTNMEGQ